MKKIILKLQKKKFIFITFFTLLIFALFSVYFASKNPIILKSKAEKITAPTSGDIIVKYKKGASENSKNKIRKIRKAIIRNKIDKLNIDVIRVQTGTAEELITQYQKDPEVEYAEPDYLTQALLVTNDPYLPFQWGQYKIQTANSTDTSAWDITQGDQSIKVAVLDTGIEETHTDLVGKVVENNNFTTSALANDLHGHGTHVAGIIAANTNNNFQFAGVGYNSTLMNGKVLGDNGSGNYSWLINGIVWAADNGARVINISLGGPSSSQALEEAINYAWSKGAVVVAAAGNCGGTDYAQNGCLSFNQLFYPAYYTSAIAVGATDTNDQRASFSTYGNWVDVAAPGASIWSTYKDNAYANMSGTSMASPHVAGVAALIWASGICSDNICIRNQIEQTTDDISGIGTFWSNGRINAYKAVQSTTPSPSPSTIPTITPTPTTAPTPTPTTAPSPTPTEAPVSTLKINPIADSEVRQSNLTRNYGTAKSIEVDGSPIRVAYLKFDLSGLTGKTIKSAVLKLRITGSSKNTQNIKAVSDNSWTETGITYKNRPSVGSIIGTISNAKSNTWNNIDVLSYIQSKAGNIISLGIDSTGSDDLDFTSRNSSSNKPELIITYQ